MNKTLIIITLLVVIFRLGIHLGVCFGKAAKRGDELNELIYNLKHNKDPDKADPPEADK